LFPYVNVIEIDANNLSKYVEKGSIRRTAIRLYYKLNLSILLLVSHLGGACFFSQKITEKNTLRINPCNLMQVMLTQEKMKLALCLLIFPLFPLLLHSLTV